MTRILSTGGGVHPHPGRHQHPGHTLPPPGRHTPCRHLLIRRLLQRTVRILLECILVTFEFCLQISLLFYFVVADSCVYKDEDEDWDEDELIGFTLPLTDRFYWSAWDPCNVSEALNCVANVLTFARLFYLLAINEHLGPMLISLERMVKVRLHSHIAINEHLGPMLILLEQMVKLRLHSHIAITNTWA